LLKKSFVATSFIYRIMYLSVNFNFVMFSTLFLLLMLSTLQRKENRLIEQTVFFALYESPFHAVYAHECILYKKEINMILLTLISFDCLI